MKTKILVTLIVIGFLAACAKDKYNTTPTLTLKSVGNKTIPRAGLLSVQFELTDKEGDISDTLYYKKIRRNRVTTSTLRDSLKFQIPEVSSAKTSLLNLELRWQEHLVSSSRPGTPPQPDTLTLQFFVKDKAKNKSEVISIDNVIVIQ